MSSAADEMISHDDIRMDQPLEANAGRMQAASEGSRCTGAREEVAPVIAAIDHVVARPGVFKAKSAGHGITAWRAARNSTAARTRKSG